MRKILSWKLNCNKKKLNRWVKLFKVSPRSVRPKLSYFFPRKSLYLTHQVFFSQEKFESHSRKKMISAKKGEKGNFRVYRILEVFIFSNDFFFFRGKVHISLTHSFSGSREKKTAVEKKTPFSLTHPIFAQKWQKLYFSRELKKYGSFGRADQSSRNSDTWFTEMSIKNMPFSSMGYGWIIVI